MSKVMERLRIHIEPLECRMAPGESQQFTVGIGGTDTREGVLWSASDGRIDQTGLYSAPPVKLGKYPKSVVITATSLADSSQKERITVELDHNLSTHNPLGYQKPISDKERTKRDKNRRTSGTAPVRDVEGVTVRRPDGTVVRHGDADHTKYLPAKDKPASKEHN